SFGRSFSGISIIGMCGLTPELSRAAKRRRLERIVRAECSQDLARDALCAVATRVVPNSRSVRAGKRLLRRGFGFALCHRELASAHWAFARSLQNLPYTCANT